MNQPQEVQQYHGQLLEDVDDRSLAAAVEQGALAMRYTVCPGISRSFAVYDLATGESVLECSFYQEAAKLAQALNLLESL